MQTVKAYFKDITCRRIVVYIIGIAVLACGITMNTKTDFGVSPIISVAYNVSVITGVPLGVMTFVYYVLLILLQRIMLGKDFEAVQWLQAITSLITSAFIQFYDFALPSPDALALRILMLVGAIVITAAGICLTVGAGLVPNPADGLAKAVGIKTGKSLGFSKNLLDFVCMVAAIVIGLVFLRRIMGIGLGTVATMIFTGRVVALLQRPSAWLFKRV